MNPVDLKKLLRCIDLTNLNENCTPDDIKKLCADANTSYGSVAALCVYPSFVSLAWTTLIKNSVHIATVVNFPNADHSHEQITHDIQHAILDGATEIDAVMPHDDDGEFVSYCKKLCGHHATLKIILESGEIDDVALIKKSQIAISHGADFLKTSTGKTSTGATPHAARLILQTIKNSRKTVGFKASGGIKTLEDAAIYVNLTREILGESAFSPERFRIGTSRLLQDILCAFQNPSLS